MRFQEDCLGCFCPSTLMHDPEMLRLGAELGFPGSNAQVTLHYAEADIGLDIPIEA